MNLKRIYPYGLLLILLFTHVACDNNIDRPGAALNVASDVPSIALGQLSEEESVLIEIPMSVFGSETQMSGAILQLFRNGSIYVKDLSPEEYFQDSSARVVFVMNGVKADDILGFRVVFSGGSESYFEGIADDVDDSLATFSVEEE